MDSGGIAEIGMVQVVDSFYNMIIIGRAYAGTD